VVSRATLATESCEDGIEELLVSGWRRPSRFKHV
jgi:hypothetical protein